jgi:peptidoglycan/LPS O-acetylase OafA/YrhL
MGMAGLIALQVCVPRPHWSPLWAVRTDALMLGALIAVWQDHFSYRAMEPVFLRHRWIATPVVAVTVGMLAVLPSKLHIVSFSTGSLAICCGVLVWLASYDQHYLWPRGAGKHILTWVGTRSYSLYLTHLVCYALTREVWHSVVPPATVFDASYTLPFLATALGLTVLLSELNYRLVETPMRQRGRIVAAALLAKLCDEVADGRPVLTSVGGLSSSTLTSAVIGLRRTPDQ